MPLFSSFFPLLLVDNRYIRLLPVPVPFRPHIAPIPCPRAIFPAAPSYHHIAPSGSLPPEAFPLQKALQAEFDVAGVICHALSLPSFVCLPMRCSMLLVLLLLVLGCQLKCTGIHSQKYNPHH